MNEQQILSILEKIPWAKQIGRSGDWHIKATCLMAHRHSKGFDSHASMTISFDVPIPWVECFACGYKKPLEQTLYALVADNRLAPEVALEFTQAKAGLLSLTPPNRSYNTQDYSIPLEHLRKNVFSPSAVSFLRTKGITKQSTIDAFQIAYVPSGHSDEWMGEDENGDPKSVNTEGILLPVLTEVNGKTICVGAQMRLMEGKFRYFALYKFNASARLFGEHLLPKVKGKPLFLVEGPLDAAHLYEMGSIAVAMFGTHFTREKAQLILGAEPRIVNILFDPDKAGKEAIPKTEAILKEYGIPFCSHLATKDPKMYTQSDLVHFNNHLQL